MNGCVEMKIYVKWNNIYEYCTEISPKGGEKGDVSVKKDGKGKRLCG